MRALYRSVGCKTIAAGNVSRRLLIIDGSFVPTCQAKPSNVSGGQVSLELGAGSGTAGSEVDIESKDPQSLNEAVVVPRGSSMSDASNSPQAHMRVHIHGSWAWIMR